jgi:endonuclease YncB( thermonuclease family)/methylphosphotriester-DNA--protein-cysteine methyltransferase
MKALRKPALLLIMLACAVAYAAQPAPVYAQNPSTVGNNVKLVIDGKVINVHDGDTVTVLDEKNKKTHIRLQGIDAPELKQEFGSVSQQNLSRMVLGKQVTIVWTKIDKYRRTVGTIMLDGHDINIEQVKAGLAWHFKKYEDEQNREDRVTYAAAEQQARSAKLGLWHDPNPTPPGDWRVDVKTKRWGPPPPDGTIIGTRNSKKYHRPDCPGYRDMAERNRVFFKTVDEAEAAGYKRAGNCPAEVTPLKPSSANGNSSSRPASANTAATKATVVSAPASVTSPNGNQSATGLVVGNKNSKIYHVPGCSTYNSVSEKNRVTFASAEEAEKAGYRKSKACH